MPVDSVISRRSMPARLANALARGEALTRIGIRTKIALGADNLSG